MRATSPGASLRTISPYTHWIVVIFPGQSLRLCGQPSHVAWCGSHSAGMRKPRAAGVSVGDMRERETGKEKRGRKGWSGWLIEKPAAEAGVGVDPPIAQERPAAAYLLDPCQVYFAYQHRLAVGGCF